MTYVSEDFFNFICNIEKVYLSNANIGMMIAYHDGSLFDQIVSALLDDDAIMDLFKTKLSIVEWQHNERKLLLGAVLTKFKNIRGRWFVNNIRGQQAQIKDAHTTRKGVAVKSEIAQAKANLLADFNDSNISTEENNYRKMYKTAEDNIDNVYQQSDDEEDA